MENSQFLNLFYAITLLFFSFEVSMYLAYLVIFLKDKSFKVKIESKILVLKSWFLGLFIVASFYTMYQLKTSSNFSITIFVFLVGFTLMVMLYVLPKLIIKNKKFLVDTLKMKTVPVIEANIFTEKLEIFKSDHEAILEGNSITNNDIKIITPVGVTNVDENNQDIFENYELNKLDKSSNLKLNHISHKTAKNTITPILRKNSPVIPDNNADDIILEKFGRLKEAHGAYCNYDDFRNLLSNITIEKKILFTDKYGSPINSKKTEFLRILNDILDGNIVNHPNNLKVRDWIEESFDNKNFEGEKITDVDISRFK
ncbi:hypothetical protein ACMDB5_12960 [Flavobacterium sp. W1B]|uniref:hypothetical protein n=1 Tax=Flavobacterium sp. W1B TaxID=3394146 RepID=UPI0039BC5E91